MLIIRRREGEAILIGQDIAVEVLEVSGGRVKLGIRAPAEVLIVRQEMRLAEQENLAAARGVSQEAMRALLLRLRPPG